MTALKVPQYRGSEITHAGAATRSNIRAERKTDSETAGSSAVTTSAGPHEQHWREKGLEICCQCMSQTAFAIRRMTWMKRDGRWPGEWTWEAYDCPGEQLVDSYAYVNRRWQEMGKATRHGGATSELATASNASVVPQEVLLGMVHQLNHVSHTAVYCGPRVR